MNVGVKVSQGEVFALISNLALVHGMPNLHTVALHKNVVMLMELIVPKASTFA